MDALTRSLKSSIPFEKAARYYAVELKGWQPLPQEDDELLAECIEKAAAAQGLTKLVDRGKQLLTGSRYSVLKGNASRARNGIIAKFPGTEEHFNDLAAKELGKVRATRGALAAGAVGTGALAARGPSPTKTAMARFDSLVAGFKQAADSNSSEVATAELDGGMSSPSATDANPGDYLAKERQARDAEEQTASSYFQQVLQLLREELAQTQEQAAKAQQEAAVAASTQEAHASELASAQQAAQLAQQAAVKQVQSANATAEVALQQAVDAENRVLQSKALEATAKIQQQQVRGQLFDLASQGLPGTEPEGAGVIAPGAPEAPSAGMNEAGESPTAEGMPGQQAAQEGTGAAAPPTAVQPPNDTSGGAGGGSGTGPQSMSDGGGTAPQQDPTATRTGQFGMKVGSQRRPLVRRPSI